jgi:hypothetical protein
MVHLFGKEEVVSPGAFALGETSFFEDRRKAPNSFS